MKEYFFIVKTKKIVEFDGKSISIYSKSSLGVRYLPKMKYWKGEESELVENLRAKLKFNKSKLGKIVHGEEKLWQE